jgi:hypothetical protein
MNWKPEYENELRDGDHADLARANAMQREGVRLRGKVYERCRSRARYKARMASDSGVR